MSRVKLSGQQWLSLALAVLAALSAAVVVLTRDVPGTGERLDRSRNLLGVWREDEIRSVTFHAGRKSFRLERGAGPETTARRFALLAPEREDADGAAVDRLISGLGFATPLRRVDGGEKAAFGLEKPVAALEIAMGETTLRVSLGKEAPSPAGAAYASVARDQEQAELFVIAKDVAALLLMTADDFRERSLVRIGKSEVAELVLTRAEKPLRLVRAGGGFRIEGAERASRDGLEPVFEALARLELQRFSSLSEAETARRGAPLLVVRVKPTDEKLGESVVELGGSCPGSPDAVVAVARSPRVRAGCVERSLLAQLEVEREALVDRAPFQARADEVETLRIERGEKKLVLTRRGSSFLLREPSEAAVELDAGNERIAAVLRAAAELAERPDPKALGLEPPSGKVIVTRVAENDAAVEETLFLGRTDADGTLAARRADDGAVLLFGRDAARAFAVDATLLKGLRVVDFALSSLVELELTAPEPQRLRRTASGFELVQPPGFVHDGGLATDAVLALGSLVALRFVADADDGTFGFSTPTLVASARWDGDGGVRSARLVVGRSTPGGYFAKLDGDPSVFVIERSVADRLGTLLVDRSVFMGDEKTLARVTITANGVSRTLERKRDELVPAASSGIDPSVAARLIEALGALRAEAALHTGPARPHEGFGKPALEVRYEPVPGLGKPRSFRVGASAVASGAPTEGARQAARYARAEGVEATFAVADAKLKVLFDLF
jgi:hypothetical protein